MPFVVQKTDQCPASRPYGVFTETAHGSGQTKGDPHGCFPTQAKAREQQKALYASVPDARDENPGPPNLDDATSDTRCCATCHMFDDGKCWGFGDWPVEPDEVCDNYSPSEAGDGSESKAETGPTEVPMTTTASPVVSEDYNRERALALSVSQRRRTETRTVHEPLEIREGTEDGKRVLRSYASLFNEPYTVRSAGHRFTEQVKPGAFKRTLGGKPDVVFRTEHNGPPLAATWSKDLRLGEDERGLWYEVDLDETDPDVQSLISKVQRGVYRDSSFAFRIPQNGDKWNDAHDQRDVIACELHRGDVSVVTFGASPSTGKHMQLRAEEFLHELGYDGLVSALVEWRDFTLLPTEERIGKVISSQSAESLRQVLTLIASAEDYADEAERMLADFLGVPAPNDEDGAVHKESVTTSEQLEHQNSEKEDAEARDDPSYEDYDVMYGLKNAKVALACVQACQLCDPGNGTDPDDNAVMAAINAAMEDIDAAIVAQAADGRMDDDEGRSQVGDFWKRVGELAHEVGWEVKLSSREDGETSFSFVRGEEVLVFSEQRSPLTAKARKALPSSAFVFPDDRRYPIQDISHARNALARSSGKPEEAKVKKAVYAKYPSLKPSASRAAIAPNDTEDLALDLRMRRAS